MSEITKDILGDDEPGEMLLAVAEEFGITDPERVSDLAVRLSALFASVEARAYLRVGALIGDDPLAMKTGAIGARMLGMKIMSWATESLDEVKLCDQIFALGNFVEALKNGDVQL